ncbi:MAG: hypothetical protein VX642_06365 [Bdellovibrionota bacterium]|nr:hypothetical protein [Bdellovibrionota bacterium]
MKTIFKLFPLIFVVSCASTGSKTNVNSVKYTKGSRSISKPEVSTWTKCHSPKEGKDWKNWVNATNTCVKKGNWSRVRKNAGLMLEHFPASPWGAYFYSLEAYKLQHLDRAEWMIEKALSMSGEAGIFYFQKAKILQAKGEKGIARQAYIRAFELDNSLSAAAAYLAVLSFKDQDYEQVLKYLASVDKDQKDESLWVVEMESAKATKDYEKALNASSFLVSKYTKNFKYQLRHAQVLEEIPEKRKEALQAYKKIHKSLKNRSLRNKFEVNLPDKINSLQNAIAKAEAEAAASESEKAK